MTATRPLLYKKKRFFLGGGWSMYETSPRSQLHEHFKNCRKLYICLHISSPTQTCPSPLPVKFRPAPVHYWKCNSNPKFSKEAYFLIFGAGGGSAKCPILIQILKFYMRHILTAPCPPPIHKFKKRISHGQILTTTVVYKMPVIL